jgi:hypothetical protein
MKLLNPGCLKNRNEYDAAFHRWEVRVEAEKRTDERRKSKKLEKEARQGVQSLYP